MVQDRGRKNDVYPQDAPKSHARDMVPIYESTASEAEMQAGVIRGVLDSNGIPSVLIRPGPIPPVGFHLLLPRDKLAEARKVLKDAQRGGSQGASEGEAASEEP